MPPGLVFGPCSVPPPRFKRTKTVKRKAWYWSQTEKKRKVLSKSGSERKRKAELPSRKKKREDLSRKKKREDLLKTRAQRREEEKQRKEDVGEPLVAKKKAKNLKGHHGAEQVDATILKLLGKSHKSCKKVAPKSKNSDRKVEEVAAAKWRHGMREERRESWSTRAQLRKRTPRTKKLVKIVDVGADYEAEGYCNSGDGAAEMVWPLPIQAPLEPMPPCMEFYQVRIERTI